MILQALKEYYDRKGNELPPIGWLEKGIDYVIVLRPEGTVQQIECLQEYEGKKVKPFPSVAPQIGKQAIKHTNAGDDANLLWDNSAFVFGVGNKGDKKRNSFIETVHTWLGDVEDEGVSSVLAFYSTLNNDPNILSLILNNKEYGEAFSTGAPIITFRLLGDSCRFVYEREPIRKAIAEKWGHLTENIGMGICLVTGDRIEIEKNHIVTKGVWGGQTSGCNIVAFNAKSFESYNKKQGANAPVGKPAAFAYTTSLNHLLAQGSKQRMQVGDASTVFWSAQATILEEHFGDFFSDPPKDDPDKNTRAVESLFSAVHNGTLPPNEAATRFYVLGLAPNASRISIRFWIADTVKGMSEKICQHFDDLKITHGSKTSEVLSMFRLMVAIAPLGKSENVPPNLAGDTMRAILQGLPYPRTLLQSAVRRIRAERDINYARAAIIKACINRELRYNKTTGERELTVSLDESNNNIGYRLGRLFATLEKVQQEASPGLNATIRDRFYGAASGTPVAVFASLMRLKNYNLAKLEHPGRRVQFEKLISQIMEGISDFPPHLSLADQGRFAIGYYHQMQDFFTKKLDKTEE